MFWTLRASGRQEEDEDTRRGERLSQITLKVIPGFSSSSSSSGVLSLPLTPSSGPGRPSCRLSGEAEATLGVSSLGDTDVAAQPLAPMATRFGLVPCRCSFSQLLCVFLQSSPTVRNQEQQADGDGGAGLQSQEGQRRSGQGGDLVLIQPPQRGLEPPLETAGGNSLLHCLWRHG